MDTSVVTHMVDRWSPQQVTHLPPAWDLLLPLAQTPDRRDQQLLLSLLKDTDKVLNNKKK